MNRSNPVNGSNELRELEAPAPRLVILTQLQRLQAERRRYGVREREHLRTLSSEPEAAPSPRTGGVQGLKRRRTLSFLPSRGWIERNGAQVMRDESNTEQL